MFRLRDRLGMGIISSGGRLGAPQGPQINFGKISTQLGLEESSKPAEKAICNLGDRFFESSRNGRLLCRWPSHSVCVCGLNQLIGSFSRSVPNKLPSRQKLTLERDRRLFMGDTKAGAHLITTDNCLFLTKTGGVSFCQRQISS